MAPTLGLQASSSLKSSNSPASPTNISEGNVGGQEIFLPNLIGKDKRVRWNEGKLKLGFICKKI
ncbi:MAG: hypothetical protein A2648_00310 [Candidatus Lloydbacteria bacterium RIFCSPHIGHO2_01_FULL_41_20]|uniref:Uncharacterized protein n=1 Tax=Candidatus Lloydbacteria bacterium RIFCSPHIGHO2_01_FULL_41_20 TaxID=1798657 RepID=A0A1G2CUB1_9BACT|nr:MAG: hypothetical protein A2648_00310 [Candidatus Lloydbacteria bacterium RIFCSPHIGHO2_01_FULL_41_20]